MPRWPVKEKEPEKKFDLRDHVHIGEVVQKYLGVEICSCTYSAAGGVREAVVAMVAQERPVLCHDVSAATNYIKTWKAWNRRHAGS